MASQIDISALTLNAEEAQEIGKLIIEKAFVNSDLKKVHDIETGVLWKTQIPFAGQMADSLKKSTGCTPNQGSGIVMTEKFWEPEIFDVRFEHCAADLNKLFKLFGKASRINPDFYDKINSQEMGVIYALIEQMLMSSIPTKVWFSDKSAADISGGGVFTDGTDVDLYNTINGLFQQIFADIQSGDSNYIEISENSGASYSAQALGTDAAYNYMQEAVNSADSRLLQDPDAQFLVTRTMYDNYKSTLRNKTLGAGFIEITEGGKTSLYFDGYEVVPMYEWDRIIKSVQDNGTTYNLPHRMVFTTPGNIPVATLAESDLDTLTSFYDQYRKSNVVDVALSLDAKYLENYMTVAAY